MQKSLFFEDHDLGIGNGRRDGFVRGSCGREDEGGYDRHHQQTRDHTSHVEQCSRYLPLLLSLRASMQEIKICGVHQLIFPNVELLHQILGDHDPVIRRLMVLENDLELHE